MGELGAFLLVAAVVIATPGPDTALTIRNTLVGGRRAGVFTAGGVAAGQAVWTLAASAGVAALLVASEPAFLALKYAGAAYLVFLGAPGPLARVPRRGATQPGRHAGRRSRASARPASGPRQQPRQPEDGRLLHEPAAPVRRGR